jgi:hypothetical protein
MANDHKQCGCGGYARLEGLAGMPYILCGRCGTHTTGKMSVDLAWAAWDLALGGTTLLPPEQLHAIADALEEAGKWPALVALIAQEEARLARAEVAP